MPTITRHRLVTALLRPVAVTLCLPLAIAALTNISHAQPSLPQRGMSQQAIEQQFGAPDDTRPAVGQPPIARWVYPDFTVYFEGRYTLHAVSHYPPPAPAVAPALAAHPVEAEIEAPTTRPAFHFDPASGQITEAAGPASQASAETDTTAELAEAQPVPGAVTEPEAAAPAPEPAEPVSASVAAVDETEAQNEPQGDATEEAAEDTLPRFRFDPVSGRIILDSDEPQDNVPHGDTAAAAPADSAAEVNAATPEPAPKQGGYRLQW